MKISGFDWDQGNLTKIEKHGLNKEVIENIFLQYKPSYIFDDLHSQSEDRFMAFVCYLERFVIIIFSFRVQSGEILIRPISARHAHKKEVEVINEKIKKS